ncbi:MAG TPA: S1 RNA-binding domain-containing protein, partial [Spirochaetota bacterium]|nr:S1 RNA-binding domain-containing protein [Spirochaetota bacterium]
MIDFDDSQTFDDAEDFEKMLEASLSKRDNFETGEEVDGTIVQITHDQIFVDISGKSEAIIDVSEFQDESGQLAIQKGDKISAYVVSTNRGEIVLTTAIGSGVVSNDLLELAYRKGIPVSGTVIQTVKSGYTVSVGGTRCFCPLSQVDMKVPNNPESMIQKTLQFKIIRYES